MSTLLPFKKGKQNKNKNKNTVYTAAQEYSWAYRSLHTPPPFVVVVVDDDDDEDFLCFHSY